MKKSATAEELDGRFEAGEDMEDYFDHERSWRPGIAKLAKKARAATGLSQAKFAERYGIPYQTFRDWEQGKRRAGDAAIAYLRVIAKLPREIASALKDAA